MSANWAHLKKPTIGFGGSNKINLANSINAEISIFRVRLIVKQTGQMAGNQC